MKQISVVILAVFFGTVLFSQAPNKKDAKGLKQGEWAKTYDGSTAIYYKGTFKNDIPQGKFVFYYPSGSVKAINEYQNQGKDSYVVSYHENGQVMSYGKYVNQEKDSLWVYFDETGELILSEEYKKGTLNGKQVAYYPRKGEVGKSPAVLEETIFVNGKKEGKWSQYYKNGELLAEGVYKADDFDGKVVYYYPGGEKQQVNYFKDGEKHGFCISYDRMGEKEREMYYWKGLLLEDEVLEKHLEQLKKKKAEQLQESEDAVDAEDAVED